MIRGRISIVLDTCPLFFNTKGETSMAGLYAAGDEIGIGIGNAAVYGWIAGENAARYAEQVEPPDIEKCKATIEENIGLVKEIRNREEGVNWHEANLALQQIMHDYAGSIRSEALLQAGLSHLQRLRKKTCSLLMAKNQHELMHCIEVLNMFDVGELIFITAIERKETRGTHMRSDFPFANPLMEKLLVIKKVNGKPVIDWKEINR